MPQGRDLCFQKLQYILHRIIHFGFRFAKLRIYKTFLISIQCNSLFLDAVENDNRVDIIICGGGASGLLLANGLVQDPAFDHLKILLIEKEENQLMTEHGVFGKRVWRLGGLDTSPLG